MKSQSTSREPQMKSNIQIIETENPYLGWDPILGTRQNVRIVKPVYRIAIDKPRSKDGKLAFKLVPCSHKERHMFTRSIGYK